jgi:hypothetical protein
MTEDELHEADSEDLEYWLIEVEKSFNIKFADNELVGVQTFGELADHIIGKIDRPDLENCTTQQSFYKLRATVKHIWKAKSFTPQTLLSDILPRRGRIRQVELLEKELGFELELLGPPAFAQISLSCLMLISLFSFIFSVPIGIVGVLTSIGGFWLAAKIGNELTIKTVGDLARRIARKHYTQARRDSSTFNKTEIETLLAEWLCEDFYLSSAKLTRASKFSWAVPTLKQR